MRLDSFSEIKEQCRKTNNITRSHPIGSAWTLYPSVYASTMLSVSCENVVPVSTAFDVLAYSHHRSDRAYSEGPVFHTRDIYTCKESGSCHFRPAVLANAMRGTDKQ